MISDRHLMVLLCALCTCLNYADRVNISVAIIAIREQYSLTLDQGSNIMGVFFLGYLPMQLGGAVLCRRFGGKRVLSYGAILWSLFTILTPIAASFGLSALYVCRILMGLSEGVAFPGIYHFLSGWIPAAERARSVSLFLTGVHIGTMIALVVSPIIIRVSSWQTIFYSFGGIGFVWIAAWNVLAYDKDENKSGDYQTVEAANAEMDDGDTVSKQRTIDKVFNAAEQRIMKTIVTDRRCLAVLAAQTTFSWVHYVILHWLPTYFKEVYSVETTSLSFTFLPYFGMAIFANVGGWMADRLLHKGMSVTRVRKLMTLAADVSAAISLLLFASAQKLSLAIGFITLSMACMSVNSGGFESCYLDMATPEAAGLFKAVCNTFASLAGFLAVPYVTRVLRLFDGSWRASFATLVIWYMLKIGIFCFFANCERVLTEDTGR